MGKNRETDLEDILKELIDIEDSWLSQEEPIEYAFDDMSCPKCGSTDWDHARFFKGKIAKCSDCPKWYEKQ